MAKNQSLAAVALINLINAGESKPRATLQAAQACATAITLAIAARELDHWPTQAEYAANTGISERKAQKEWALFRRAFPGEDSPERIARWLYSEVGRRIEEKTAALTVPAPPDLTFQLA